MCLCGLNLLSSLQNKSDLVTHIPEEDPALGQSLFDVHVIWIKVLTFFYITKELFNKKNIYVKHLSWEAHCNIC